MEQTTGFSYDEEYIRGNLVFTLYIDENPVGTVTSYSPVETKLWKEAFASLRERLKNELQQ